MPACNYETTIITGGVTLYLRVHWTPTTAQPVWVFDLFKRAWSGTWRIRYRTEDAYPYTSFMSDEVIPGDITELLNELYAVEFQWRTEVVGINAANSISQRRINGIPRWGTNSTSRFLSLVSDLPLPALVAGGYRFYVAYTGSPNFYIEPGIPAGDGLPNVPRVDLSQLTFNPVLDSATSKIRSASGADPIGRFR